MGIWGVRADFITGTSMLHYPSKVHARLIALMLLTTIQVER